MPTAPDSPVNGAPAVPSAGRAAREDACPGALRLHTADDGPLARVRIPGGLLTSRQMRVPADAADDLGDGRLDLTSRGNLQLRGLHAPDAATALADRLAAAGLLPSYAHERARNVVASPLSGLDGHGYADVSDWVREVDALLCASPAAAGLSGRFLFALDDGRGDVAALGADVTLIARPDRATAELRLAGQAVARVPAADAPRWALRAAETFLRLAAGHTTRAWRLADVDPTGARVAGLLAVAEARATPGPGGTAAGADTRSAARGGPRLGGLPQPGGGTWVLSAGTPLGRVTARAWRVLAEIADAAAGQVRVTPWRGVVVPGVPADDAPEVLRRLAGAGFLTGEDSPWRGVTACAGRPGCAKSLADVRADAEAAVRAGAAGPGHPLLPVHFSGCERNCGRPDGARVDVMATADGHYRVTTGGTGASTATGTAARDLPAAVATARRTTPPPPRTTT
ncbi:precorrin-3B synthase [Streptomyces sp. NPDC088354]|uniref:precorrin-3B synthase n=1 Tax=Streptomyces sp. NPDC088354 TaxID=3365856 RepID=UPI003823DA63